MDVKYFVDKLVEFKKEELNLSFNNFINVDIINNNELYKGLIKVVNHFNYDEQKLLNYIQKFNTDEKGIINSFNLVINDIILNLVNTQAKIDVYNAIYKIPYKYPKVKFIFKDNSNLKGDKYIITIPNINQFLPITYDSSRFYIYQNVKNIVENSLNKFFININDILADNPNFNIISLNNFNNI